MRDRKEAPFIQPIERRTYDNELINFKSEIQSDEVIRETRTGILLTNAEVIKRVKPEFLKTTVQENARRNGHS